MTLPEGAGGSLETRWNLCLPGALGAAEEVAPALAFGNMVVLKPAEQSPASCARLPGGASRCGTSSTAGSAARA